MIGRSQLRAVEHDPHTFSLERQALDHMIFQAEQDYDAAERQAKAAKSEAWRLKRKLDDLKQRRDRL
jgi:outer membrane murein-binding lipoprotein Lpp